MHFSCFFLIASPVFYHDSGPSPGSSPWSWSRHISGPDLGPGPSPVIFLVPDLVPVPVTIFGPVTKCF